MKDVQKSDEASTIGAVFGLCGFCVALVTGLIGGHDASSALLRGLVCMVVCFGVGLACGAALRFVIREHVQDYQSRNPRVKPSVPIAEVVEESAESVETAAAV
jgi:uncharacterized protein YneF (UPF0154 family)